MITNTKILSELSKVASGAVGSLMDIKHEIEIMVSSQLEKLLQKMELATKEELNTTKEMLIKSRLEQEELKKRLDAIEEWMNSVSNGKTSHK